MTNVFRPPWTSLILSGVVALGSSAHAGTIDHVTCPPTTSVSVKDFKTDAIGWAQAFRLALSALPCGGTVVVPPGHYPVAETVDISDRITVEGFGEASVIERSGNRPLFDVHEREGVSFRRLTIDVRATSNFRTAIRFTRGRRHRVEQVRFFTTERPEFGWTIHAILARGVDELRVIDNVNEGMQFKLGAPETGAGPRTYVRGNTFIDPHNFAVSYVGRLESDTVDLLTLEGNQVTGAASNGGFFIGVDGDRNDSAAAQRILVHGNHVELEEPASVAIIVRGGVASADLIVTSNTVRRRSRQGNTNGLLIKGTDRGTRWRRIVVSNNTFSEFERGIHLRGADFQSVSLSGNVLENSTVAFFAGEGETEAVLITGNILHGGANATNLYIETGRGNATGSILAASITNNLLVDCNSNAIYLTAGKGTVLDADVLGNTLRNCDPLRVRGLGTHTGMRQ